MLFGKHVNKYYKKYFWYFFFGFIFLVFVDYIQLFLPQITGDIVDAVINAQGSTPNTNLPMIGGGNYDFLIKETIWIFLVGLGMFVGRLMWRICIFGESIRIQADIRGDMFKKTEVLSQRYYKENKTGAILSYFSNDLETVEEAFGFGIVQLVDGVFLLVMSFIKMFRINPILTSILLIPLLFLGVCAYFVDKLMERKYEKRQKAFEDMYDFCKRVRSCNKRTLESLVKVGAFSFTGKSRKQLFDNIDYIYSFGDFCSSQSGKKYNQIFLLNYLFDIELQHC